MRTSWPDVPENYLRRFNDRVRTLDPIAVTDDSSEAVVTKLYDTLYICESGTDPEPHLVAEADRDGETLHLRLHDGVQFHNGTQVTAEDVVYSFERIASSPHCERPSYLFDALGVAHEQENGEYVPGSLGVRAADEQMVIVERNGGTVAPELVLSHPTFSVVPAGYVNDVPGVDGEVSQDTFAQEPVGTGPFSLETWRQATEDDTGHLIVREFEAYHGDTPNIDGVSWVTNPGSEERYEHILAQAVDVSGTPDANYDQSLLTVEQTDGLGREHGQYGPMESGVTVDYVRVPTLGSFYVQFNTETVPRPVRQAFADVLNQDYEVEEVHGTSYEPAYHLCGPGVVSDPERLREHTVAYPYGVDEHRLDSAQERLADLGYGPDNPYELEFVKQFTDFWSLVSDRLVDDLATVGIDLITEEVDALEKQEREAAGEFQMSLCGWIADWPTAKNKIHPLSPKVDNWLTIERIEKPWHDLDDAEAGTEEELKAALQVEELNWEQAGILPLYKNFTDFVWFEHIKFPAPGALGLRRAKHTQIEIGDRPAE